jgi:hypothetical protein
MKVRFPLCPLYQGIAGQNGYGLHLLLANIRLDLDDYNKVEEVAILLGWNMDEYR